jgi:NodT family efflux transporter outer membrane factor (OMF) lipoprotein
MIESKPPLQVLAVACLLALAPGCVSLKPPAPASEPPLPAQFPGATGSQSTAATDWRRFFNDPQLAALIDAALERNQELQILMQEIAVAKSEAQARRGAVFPFLSFGGLIGADKVGRFTRDGAVEHGLEIEPGQEFPEPLGQFAATADFEWEIDIWRKLRNERDAAVLRYLATEQGRNFILTQLIAEIAESYYELLALDNRLIILDRMIEVQERALAAVQVQKNAAKVTELAVKRFEGEVLKNRGLRYVLLQQVTVTENRLNRLAGRYPTAVARQPQGFTRLNLGPLQSGLPAELLRNRPDVRQAELEVAAAGLDIKVAAARFYPSLNLSAALGLESFTLDKLLTGRESMLYGAAAGIAAPLINRSAIRAAYNGASARQLAAVQAYQQTVLKAYVETVNQLAEIRNLGRSLTLKQEQVQTLSDAVSLADQLFNSARADYTEVLLTQREALESRTELIELKQRQLTAYVKAYKALGGGIKPPVETPPQTGKRHS